MIASMAIPQNWEEKNLIMQTMNWVVRFKLVRDNTRKFGHKIEAIILHLPIHIPMFPTLQLCIQRTKCWWSTFSSLAKLGAAGGRDEKCNLELCSWQVATIFTFSYIFHQETNGVFSSGRLAIWTPVHFKPQKDHLEKLKVYRGASHICQWKSVCYHSAHTSMLHGALVGVGPLCPATWTPLLVLRRGGLARAVNDLKTWQKTWRKGT